MDPESFTYEEKESYVRFAPFMGMRSCALEPRGVRNATESMAAIARASVAGEELHAAAEVEGDALVVELEGVPLT